MNREQENMWRKLKGEEPLRSMEDIVAQFQKYVATYHEQHGYENYSDEMFIDDIIYGLGAALNEDYKFAQGFEEFKVKLIKHFRR